MQSNMESYTKGAKRIVKHAAGMLHGLSQLAPPEVVDPMVKK
eukprot:CAMPEP_0171263898 /NCGR_PEP_ID=MMETSP0790-20130122/57335_1 /TAXON_ID=2925 /ORGANISM="Alexandrium catenella, Strain OF101" /LENGTH=41 /DNA_ID= /DNA_START= /DNA_END= /DNA_ORIENTATION=